MKSLLFLSLLCLSPALSAQGFLVAGRVIDAVSGSPVARATVTLEPASAEADQPHTFGMQSRLTAAASATTGPDGTFRLADVPAGAYRLLAARRGYLASALGQHGQFATQVVTGPNVPGADAIRFPLLPLASITGTVRDSSGDPVLHPRITLFAQGSDGTSAVHQQATTLGSGDNGSFRFDNLAPGTYYLAVSGRPWWAAGVVAESEPESATDVAYPVTFWTNASSSDDGQPIRLRAGDSAEADFSLQAEPTVQVRFPLTTNFRNFPQLSSPAFDATIPTGSIGTMRRSDDVTTVAMEVAPGTYTLEEGGTEVTINVSSDVEAPSAAASSALTNISGLAAMANGTPLPQGATLELAPEASPRGLYRARRGEMENLWALQVRHRSTEIPLTTAGTFSIQVEPGTYVLGVRGDEASLRVTAAAAQGATVTPALTLHVGTTPVMLAATLADATGTVKGKLPGGDDAMILLIPSDLRAAPLYRQAEAATDGSWIMQDVVPGAYHLVAIRNGWDLAWQQPAVLRPYLADALAVEVAAKGLTVLKEPLFARQR